jgi:predicted nuclease of restriction endonuclease-like RecB superfamily
VSTVDGLLFRSAGELVFYLQLKKHNVIVKDTNKKYPNFPWHYDFKIEYQNQEYYLELCSDIDNCYITKMISKSETIDNCILIAYNKTTEFLAVISSDNILDLRKYYGHFK